MDPKEKAQELLLIFNNNYKLAYACTEEIIGALYDEGIRKPQCWYDVQTEINLLEEQNK